MPKPKVLDRPLSQAQTLALMMAESPLIWLLESKIRLTETIPYSLDGHVYQMEMLTEDHQRVCCKKGAQMGATQVYILDTLHGMIYGKYPTGVLYLFPTGDDVTEFSKSRFGPLIEINPPIAAKVKNTDSATIKKIGGSFLYLRGARSTSKIGGVKESSTKLKSIPVDRVVFDEVDEISPAMVQLALERMSHSRIQQEIYLSTPTIPDYGIDKLYQNSDQRVWMIRCEKCNTETCLELEFPDCIKLREDGSAFRACRKCGAEIFPQFGRWVPQYPSKSKDMVGYWPSQLMSEFIDPGKILRLYLDPPDGNLSEVMNSKLGMAYIDAENRLSVADVYDCCGKDPMKMGSDGPSAIGVDVGKELHCVVALKRSKKSMEVIKVTRLESFNDLHDLAKAFNCRCMVIDKYPETRKARDFQESEPYQVWLCGYQEGKKSGGTVWDKKNMEIRGNRTELLDASHALVKEQGRLILPRQNKEIEKFAIQLTNVAKVVEEDEDTKEKFYLYKRVGARGDHYRHALTYCQLAVQKINTVSVKHVVARYFRNKSIVGWNWSTA